MTYSIVAFRRWHMHVLTADGTPAGGLLMPDPDTLRSMEAAPNLVTMLHDGMPVAAGGTIELWHRRHMSWALLPAHSGPHMLAATREAYRRARAVPGRVEMTVRKDFAAGHRWAKILGFQQEGTLRQYGPDGTDFTSYVLFN